MSLLIKSATVAVLVVTTLSFGGNASAAPLGASLALHDALTPTAQFVQWGGDYDGGGYSGGGYGNVGYGRLGGYGGSGGYVNYNGPPGYNSSRGAYGSGDYGGYGGYGGSGGYVNYNSPPGYNSSYGNYGSGYYGGYGYRPYYPPNYYTRHVNRGHRDASKKDRPSQSSTR